MNFLQINLNNLFSTIWLAWNIRSCLPTNSELRNLPGKYLVWVGWWIYLILTSKQAARFQVPVKSPNSKSFEVKSWKGKGNLDSGRSLKSFWPLPCPWLLSEFGLLDARWTINKTRTTTVLELHGQTARALGNKNIYSNYLRRSEKQVKNLQYIDLIMNFDLTTIFKPWQKFGEFGRISSKGSDLSNLKRKRLFRGARLI